MENQKGQRNIRILVVEDDVSMRNFIVGLMEKQGFLVSEASDGEEGISKIRETKPDILILDNLMPKKSGRELLREIRMDAEHSDIPVLMVTGVDDETTTIEAFKEGVDDYITKPFKGSLLAARVWAVLRRSKGVQESSSSFLNGRIDVDPREKRVLIDNQEIKFTVMEFKIFWELLKNKGKPLNKSDIGEIIGSSAAEGSDNISVHIHALRKKLQPFQVSIENKRGFGYYFAA